VDDSGVKWFIPLFISTGREPELVILDEAQKEFVINLPHPDA